MAEDMDVPFGYVRDPCHRHTSTNDAKCRDGSDEDHRRGHLLDGIDHIFDIPSPICGLVDTKVGKHESHPDWIPITTHLGILEEVDFPSFMCHSFGNYEVDATKSRWVALGYLGEYPHGPRTEEENHFDIKYAKENWHAKS